MLVCSLTTIDLELAYLILNSFFGGRIVKVLTSHIESHSLKEIIKKYIDDLSLCKFNVKFPTLLVISVLLSLTFAEGVHDIMKYISGSISLLLMILASAVKV